MTKRTTTLYGLLDQAIPSMMDQLKEQGVGPLMRVVIATRLKHNDKLRDQIVAELALKVRQDEEFQKLCPDCCALMDAEGFMLTKPFSIDIDNIAKLLDLILKYLPAILALFM